MTKVEMLFQELLVNLLYLLQKFLYFLKEKYWRIIVKLNLNSMN